MKLLMLTCADSVVIDLHTNRASLFNLLDEIQSPVFPAILYSVSVFTLVTRDAGEADPQATLRVTLNERTLLDAPMPIVFQDLLRLRGNLTIQGLVIAAPGTLRFEVRFGDALAGTWLVPVINVGQAQVAAAPQIEAPPAQD